MDAWLALLDTDLIATLCIVFMIHLLLRPPHLCHQPPASLQNLLPSLFLFGQTTAKL